MKNITVKILLIMTTLFFYCGKNYHSKGYSESDEYDGVIGKSLMDASFFEAMINDLDTRGIIKKADPIDSTKIYLSTLKSIDSLNLGSYKVTSFFPSTNGFKGIDFFPSLKVLNVKDLNFTTSTRNDTTNSIRLIKELYRVRNLFKLDTTKIYFHPNIETLANQKVIYGEL